MIIDEKREKVLTKLTKTKKGVKKIESDHNPIVSKLRLKWNMRPKKEKLELFNLKRCSIDCKHLVQPCLKT